MPDVAAVVPVMRAFGAVLDRRSDDEPALAERLAADGVAGVVTFTDALLPQAGRLASALGLPGHSAAATGWLTSKRAQRRRLNDAHVGHVASLAVDPDAAIADPVLPAVLKPDLGTSSADTFVVRDGGELATALAERPAGVNYVLEALIPPGAHPAAEWLGDYVSVETAVVRGVPQHFGICDRLPTAPPARERGILFPTALDPQARGAVEGVATDAIAALEITDALVHTEIKLSPDGPQVIEVNGRLGGDVERLCQRVSDLHPVRMALEVSLGRAPAVPQSAPRGVVVNYSVLPPVWATGLERLPDHVKWRTVPGVFAVQQRVRPGEPVSWRHGTVGSAVDVWVDADDHTQLRHRLDAVRDIEAKEVAWT